MRVLVLCASERSYQQHRAQWILHRFGLNAGAADFFYVGPGLTTDRDHQCARTIQECLPAFGRKKFDILLNEYCPVHGDFGILPEIIVAIQALAKRHAIVITPIIQKNPARSADLRWEEFRSPSYGQEEVAWPDLMEELGFEVAAYDSDNTLVLFQR